MPLRDNAHGSTEIPAGNGKGSIDIVRGVMME